MDKMTILAVLSYDGSEIPEVDFVLEGDVDHLARLLLELGPHVKTQVWQVDLVTGAKDLIAGEGCQQV